MIMKRVLLAVSLGSFVAVSAFANAPVATLNVGDDVSTSAPAAAAPVTTATPVSTPTPVASDDSQDNSSDVTPTDQAAPQVVDSQAVLSSLTPDQRLTRLENQVTYLNTYANQINSLTTQLNTLRGQVEDLTYQVNSLKQQLAAASPNQIAASSQTTTQALNASVNAAASAGAAAVSATTSANTTPASASALSTNQPVSTATPTPPTPQEQSDYQAAYNLMLQKQYAQATTGFNTFLTQYPQSSFTTNVHYWLGDLYLAQGQPDDASQQYRMVVNDTTATQRPDAMLKLGTILLAYGDSAHAKQLFQALIQQYPNTSAATQAQARLKNM